MHEKSPLEDPAYSHSPSREKSKQVNSLENAELVVT
jgi:hypothetical protein